MTHPKMRWTENDPALAPQDRTDWIAVLPLGAHEGHGPHLPLETDTLIAAGVADWLMNVLPAHLPVTVLPVEPVGYSPEHLDVPGTRSLGYSEAIERWLGLAEMLQGQGIRRLVLLNAHGGNSPLMTIVATEARIRFNMLVVATAWTRFGQPEGWIAPEDKAIDIHGGDIETSVMLALHPEHVRMDKAERFGSRQSEFAARFAYLRAYGPHAFGWKMSDLNPKGVAGNASAATAERGEQLLAHAVRGLVALLEDVAAFDVDTLR
jgi:creatinine amidohydrolase